MARARVERGARAKRLAESRRLQARPAPSRPGARNELDWQLICKAAAVCFLVGAGVIHAVWVVIHLEEWASAGVFFLLLALGESALAFALITLPARRTYFAAIALSVGTVAVWAVSRTVGMPIGPEAGLRESVGVPDLMATLFELLTAVALVPVALAPSGGSSRRSGFRGGSRAAELTYALVACLGLYTIGLTAAAVVPAAVGHQPGSVPSRSDHGAHATDPNGAPTAAHSAHTAEDPDGAAASVHLATQEMSFGREKLSMAARTRVTVHLENLDQVSHNFAVYRDAGFERALFKGDNTEAGASGTYKFPSPAPGRYWFRCDLHPLMNGEISFS